MRISDWSSDVCSSDLVRPRPFACCNPPHHLGEIAEWRTTSSGSARGGITCTAAEPCAPPDQRPHTDRKRVVSGQSVSVRVDLGGRRIINKKRETREQWQHGKEGTE